MPTTPVAPSPTRSSPLNSGAVVFERGFTYDAANRLTSLSQRETGLCSLMPATDVAELEGLDKTTVCRIDKKWLGRREARRPEHPVTRMGIDEIAIRKGHKYATVFYDLERREVIGMTLTRRQRAVSRFFRRWGKEKCQAVCMDLWAPYLNSVRRHLKNAAVVFDKFHVYTCPSEAIEAVHRHEQQIADEKTGQLIQGTRWLWLKARGNLKRKDKYTLAEIMKVNRRLQRAYVLKEDFDAVYASDDAEVAAKFLRSFWDFRGVLHWLNAG